MRASLITALALGCCLHAGQARGDDFDDDFGSLPPPPPRPALPVSPEPAAPAPERIKPSESPAATSTPAVAPAVDDDIADPWYGSYPPLDDEDAPPPLPEPRAQFVHPTIDGLLGGVHVVDAASGSRGSFRVGVQGGFFRKDGFLTRGDRHRQGTGALLLNVTPIEHLELAASVAVASTENRGNDPQLIQVVGDTRLFAKGYAHVVPWLALGGDLELGLLNGVGSFGVSDGAVNVGLRANASADLRALERALPLILRGNIRYLFDNSGKLVRGVERDRYDSLSNPSPRESEYRNLLTPAERNALGIHRVDQLTFAFGLEVPLRPHPRVHVNPLLEWSVAVPINRQDFSCLATSIAGQRDGCLEQTGFATRPSTLTVGMRTQPYVNGLGLLLAVDVATSGARDFVRELAPQPRYVLRFALSYAYDPNARPRPRVQRIEIPAVNARGRVIGQVVDTQNGAPLPNAIVHFDDTSLSDVVTDATGAFRSAELNPGAQGMRVRAEGYREALCVAVVGSQGSEVSARCELTPSAYYGQLEGRITDTAGHAIANARITLRGASEAMLGSDGEGNFRVTKLIEGDYELLVAADGYFPRASALTIARGAASTPALALIPRPEGQVVRVTAKRIALLKPIAFAPESAILLPEDEPLLAEIAEQLQKHPELAQLEIQAHGEDGTGALTQQRADAVRGWLVSAGVAPERLSAKGYGTTRPLVPNITPANRARNRRIELVVK
ncbi:MAG TPA: carboxypeptidase regulatory-like domain-containing protein [Polyangiales bacterium]|nr:carboxypeptidase regulatory-like domain-containing protein [Polyangiales bacterium]